MPIGIPRSLVEFILLGPEDDRRQLQDSPILGDVWVEFAKKPDKPLELLITPYKENAAGAIASELSDCDDIKDADIAYLQGIVAARLSFEEVLRFVVPMTNWWHEPRTSGAIEKYRDEHQTMESHIGDILSAARVWLQDSHEVPTQDLDTRKRYIALAGLIFWARAENDDPPRAGLPSKEQIKRILVETKDLEHRIAGELLKTVFKEKTYQPKNPASVWTVSLNRRATPALTKSVPAVKADAARTLFTVKCSEIVWAIIDSGSMPSMKLFMIRIHGRVSKEASTSPRSAISSAWTICGIRISASGVPKNFGSANCWIRHRKARQRNVSKRWPKRSRTAARSTGSWWNLWWRSSP